ncbi:hypothetical protein MRB53_030626 [Persea americana]|uniref:Uncharacterized protein n=1 Tax=Persea americana TaxID=3435 RepID=A0ACC2KMU5_PERAE|nr:hypothetical protein MRB53_030626 [Persea americana]
MCKAENSEDLAARVYPHINKLFQRSVASIPHSRSSNGLLLLNSTTGSLGTVVSARSSRSSVMRGAVWHRGLRLAKNDRWR